LSFFPYKHVEEGNFKIDLIFLILFDNIFILLIYAVVNDNNDIINNKNLSNDIIFLLFI